SQKTDLQCDDRIRTFWPHTEEGRQRQVVDDAIYLGTDRPGGQARAGDSLTMGDEMIEVVVSKLGIDPGTKTYVVVLQEKGAARLLPIWIGQAEAESIVMHMHNMKRAR